MGNTMRKQPQPVDIDDLFEQMERERKGEAPAQPAASSGGGGFLAACFEEQATPDFDVDTIHLRYPITDEERVRNAPSSTGSAAARCRGSFVRTLADAEWGAARCTCSRRTCGRSSR